MVNVGDKVKVVNRGKVYATYEEWAKKHGLSKFKPRREPDASQVFTVKAKGEHGWPAYNREALLGIVGEEGEEFIIGEGGVEVVKETNLPDEFVIRCIATKEKYKFVKTSAGFDVIFENGRVSPNLYSNELAEKLVKNSMYEIVEKRLANGVDADGNPMHFTKDMLKPFMRVETANGDMWIPAPNVQCPTDGLVLAKPNGWLRLSDIEGEETLDEFRAKAVYDAPKVNGHLLNLNFKGKLIWQAESPERVKLKEEIKSVEAEIELLKDKLHTLTTELEK